MSLYFIYLKTCTSLSYLFIFKRSSKGSETALQAAGIKMKIARKKFSKRRTSKPKRRKTRRKKKMK
jgi:hypothetical protein